MFSYFSNYIQTIHYPKNMCVSWSLQAFSIHISQSDSSWSKRAYKTCRFSSDSSGSATVEASIVLPLFLLSMMVIVAMCGCVRTRHTVYEGLQETAQYLAEYEYLYSIIDEGLQTDILDGMPGNAVNKVTAYTKLSDYIDNIELVEKYVLGGMAGFAITRAEYDARDGYIYIELQYTLKANVVLFGELEWTIHEKIRQKAYIGYMDDEREKEGVQYVYITENASVYHTRRNCYHISLSIHQISESELYSYRDRLTPCGICAKYNTGLIYITGTGNHYHTTISCSGLKRTVYRVKLEDYPYLPACSNCG